MQLCNHHVSMLHVLFTRNRTTSRHNEVLGGQVDRICHNDWSFSLPEIPEVYGEHFPVNIFETSI